MDRWEERGKQEINPSAQERRWRMKTKERTLRLSRPSAPAANASKTF